MPLVCGRDAMRARPALAFSGQASIAPRAAYPAGNSGPAVREPVVAGSQSPRHLCAHRHVRGAHVR